MPKPFHKIKLDSKAKFEQPKQTSMFMRHSLSTYSRPVHLFHSRFPINCNYKATASISKIPSCCAHTAYLLDELPHRDLYYLNDQLVSHSRNANFHAAWALFCSMHRASLELNSYTFSPVLSACSALQGEAFGKQVHTSMIKRGVNFGIIVQTSLMDMYSKLGCFDDSVMVFEEMEYRDVVTWNSLLSCFLRHGLAKEALGVFGRMASEGVEASEFTLSSVLKACASVKAFQLGKQVHNRVVVMGRDLVVLGTTLITFYAGVGHICEAIKMFNTLRSRRGDVMCNSLIAGCVANRKYKEAFSVLSTMKPNAVALTSAIAACSEISDLSRGLQIHGVAVRFCFLDTQLCNVLIDMYAKCGKILNARPVFDGICHKNVVSWTSMIDAYGRHGLGREALDLFNKMGEEGSEVLPNSVTLLAVLSACGHSGLVEEGRELFELVREKYGLDPGEEHYCCLMDILGRAGRIEDVWCLYHDMDKKGTIATTAVWATLLNACSLNKDVLRGEMAAEHLLELKPENPGHHVLLSNFYASIERWDCVERLRSSMKEKGLNKEAGSSWVVSAYSHGNSTNAATMV